MSRFRHLTRDTDHRPWPTPSTPWVMTMSWCDLLFAHWQVDPERLWAHVPEGLELDTFEGRAYVGVVPFRMEAVGPRGFGGLPARLPSPRAFPELNIRTYVRRTGTGDGPESRPGVLFLSLDATSPLAIWGARTFFHLPYVRADITVRRDGGRVFHRCRRRDPRMASGVFEATFEGTGETYSARPGSFDHWLTERYCLYATNLPGEARRGDLWRGDIHHPPWPLRRAEVDLATNTLAVAHDLVLEGPPIAHCADRIDVVAWWPERLTATD